VPGEGLSVVEKANLLGATNIYFINPANRGGKIEGRGEENALPIEQFKRA